MVDPLTETEKRFSALRFLVELAPGHVSDLQEEATRFLRAKNVDDATSCLRTSDELKAGAELLKKNLVRSAMGPEGIEILEQICNAYEVEDYKAVSARLKEARDFLCRVEIGL